MIYLVVTVADLETAQNGAAELIWLAALIAIVVLLLDHLLPSKPKRK